MKQLFIFLLVSILYTSVHAQQIGSKVSLTGVDGKMYTGVITGKQGDKYKVKYDGYDFDAWLTAGQFKVTNINAPSSSQSGFNAGDKVEGFDNGKWYNATILE